MLIGFYAKVEPLHRISKQKGIKIEYQGKKTNYRVNTLMDYKVITTNRNGIMQAK